MSESKANDIARSYYVAMMEGQDWISLPPNCPVSSDELRVLAETMARTVTRSPIILTLANGSGSSTQRLRSLLARVWAAGYKAGSATTGGNVPRETSQEDQ